MGLINVPMMSKEDILKGHLSEGKIQTIKAHGWLEDVYAAMDQHANEYDGWIKSSDRLPKECATVMVFYVITVHILDGKGKLNIVDTGYLHDSSNSEKVEWRINGNKSVFNITHWMPLPKKP